MKVLITGASGFLGGHLAEAFTAAGHQVRALVRRTSRTELLERLGVEILLGDLKDQASLRRAVSGVETLVNAASSVDATPQEYQAATVEGTRALMSAAEEAGVSRVVHISSLGIYAVQKMRRGTAIGENHPLEQNPRFLSNYITSKIESERAALEFAERGKMKVIVLRPGIMYGPRGKWTLPRMGYPFGKNLYVLIGMGGNRLPSCYVENCARAALIAAEKQDLASGIFNILDDECLTQIEFLKRLRRDVRPQMKIIRLPYFLAYAFGWVGETVGRKFGVPWPFRTTHMFMCHWRVAYSNDHAKQVLGWTPAIGKEEALRRTMEYFRQRERISRKADLKLLQATPRLTPPATACIIGAGAIADAHLQILDQIEGLKVLAICDVNPTAARALAQKYKIVHVYREAEQMLDKEKPLAVHIVTPPQSHAALTEMAARRGCHILVEKPMAINAFEAQRMAEIAAQCGVSLCVDHNLLYDPVIVQARRIVESGDMGDIMWVESYYGFDLGSNPNSRYLLPGSEKHWTFELPGGLYQNLAPHPLSLALDVIGKPTRITAHARYGRTLPHATTDELRIMLETPKAGGLVTVSLGASPRFQYLNIFGTKMALFVDLLNKWLIPQAVIRGVPKPISRAIMNLRHGSRVLLGTMSGTVKVISKRWTHYDGMDLLIREFYASLREGGASPPVTAREGIWTMEIMDQVWEQIGMRSP